TLKRISVSVPAAVDGTSIEVLSVSISNRLSPGFTISPADLNHLVILPSATVSPSCGIRTSTRLSPIPLPTHRNILRFEEFHHALMGAFAAEPGLLGAAERRGRIGDQASIETHHPEIELLRNPHATVQVLRIQVGNQAVFGRIGALDCLVFALEGLDR